MNENKIVLIKVFSICVIGVLYVCFSYGCQGEQSSSADDKYAKIVNDILQAQQTLTTIPSLSKSFDSMTEDEAYKIQDLLAAELTKKYGPVAGYKIGYADSSSLKKNNLKVPAYGPLFKSRIIENGGTVPLRDFMKFSIENEVTFKLGKDVDRIFESVDDLKPYIESVHLGFDMSEGVFESPSSARDFIACGAGSKYFMIGEGKGPHQVDVEDVLLRIEFKDQVVYEGSSKNVLGNPWNVMLAVSNDLFRRGKPIKKGNLIFSGKAAPAYTVVLEEAAGVFNGEGVPFSPLLCKTQ